MLLVEEQTSPPSVQHAAITAGKSLILCLIARCSAAGKSMEVRAVSQRVGSLDKAQGKIFNAEFGTGLHWLCCL